MIELSNPNAQTLSENQSVIFTSTLLHTGCAECHRTNSASVNLIRKNAIYEISFNCNIGATAADTDAEISVVVDGSPLLETTSIVPTAAGGDLQNVSAATYVQTCCFPNVIVTLTNTGTAPINIGANPRLTVKRVA